MIKTLLTTTLLLSLLNASNPTIYSALGDIIYNDVEKIERLQSIEEYTQYHSDIVQYAKEVEKTKELGLQIESEPTKSRSKEYLARLRKLSKEHDCHLRAADALYKESLDESNIELFLRMINSGLIDTVAKKDEILEFYFKNIEDMNSSGVIQKYLDEDANLQEMRDAHLAQRAINTKEQKCKTQKVRQRDIEAHKELEQRLQDKVEKKKVQIGNK